jgi:hypothetical protein
MAGQKTEPTQLFEEDSEGVITLAGMACSRCGHLAFPAQHYGCEKCGATGDDLCSKALEAKGKLLAFATVNLHYGKDIDAPYIVGSIELEDGPTVRCTLVEDDEGALSHGAIMRGQIVLNSKADPNNPRSELRFGREG